MASHKYRKKHVLSETFRGFLASCLVTISTFVILLNALLVAAESYIALAVVDVVYGIFLTGCILVFRSKTSARLVTGILQLFGAMGALLALYIMWLVFNVNVGG